MKKIAAETNYIKLAGNDYGDEQIEDTREFAQFEMQEDYNKDMREAMRLARSITGGTHSLQSPFDESLIESIAEVLIESDVVSKINKILDSAPEIGPDDFGSNEMSMGDDYHDFGDEFFDILKGEEPTLSHTGRKIKLAAEVNYDLLKSARRAGEGFKTRRSGKISKLDKLKALAMQALRDSGAAKRFKTMLSDLKESNIDEYNKAMADETIKAIAQRLGIK